MHGVKSMIKRSQ